jgi:hypothetical protein
MDISATYGRMRQCTDRNRLQNPYLSCKTQTPLPCINGQTLNVAMFSFSGKDILTVIGLERLLAIKRCGPVSA